MSTTATPHSAHAIRPQDLADEAIELVERWLREAADHPIDPSAQRLAGVLQDPNGLDFTVGFVDGVVRPEDKRAAAKKLKELAPLTPKFLPGFMRGAVGLGGALGQAVPEIVVPTARKVLRQMVNHLIIDARDEKLGPAIAKLTQDDSRLNINLLGEYILGEDEARRRLEGTRRLLSRDDVDYVSIKVSSTVAPHNHWSFDQAINRVEDHLVSLYRLANASSPKKFINLDMEEYKDLDLTVAVFKRIMDRPEFLNLEAGIVLQAYLPDTLGVMMDLQEWSASRVARGGAPVKVRLVKGANLPMEEVDAAIHGWPMATCNTKQDTDTNYKAVIDYAVTAEHLANVHLGIAGHNLFDLALAWRLAQKRGATHGLDFEMLRGMAPGQAEAVKKEVGGLLLYTPVVHPEEFDVAIAYLIRRLEEGASQENIMSALFELDSNPELFNREKQRFLASLDELETITADGDPANYRVPSPARSQDRRFFDEDGVEDRVAARVKAGRTGGFENSPDSDPDLAGNREWGRDIAARMVESNLGKALVASSRLKDKAELDEVISRGVKASADWRAMTADERAAILYRAAERLEARRGELVEVTGSECGKTIDQSDPEISEAIDFANYYAMLGQQLERVEGAEFTPVDLVAVIPPWNFPVAIPTGGVLAGLAAGSSVIIKPASRAARSAAVMVEALWDAGVPKDVLQFVQVDDRDLGSELVADERVGRIILTGAYETALTFRELRKDAPVLAETSGKNAIIVTPNADLDLAAQDVVHSAFGHAGQKCSASSLVVLVGSVATSKRFRNQLIDGVSSLHVGTPDDLESQMGPVISAPSGKLLRGLTTLGPDEHWVIKPEPIESDHPLSRDTDGSTKLWSPGVRYGVKPGSEYHQVEYFGPILGVMTADTLEEAVDIVNDIEYGLTSGLHSLDADELEYWLENIQAGNLYVNRGITGAIVRRQPFGGWKRSAIGPGTKAGGPNYLHGLGHWSDAAPAQTGSARPAVAPLLRAVENLVDTDELIWLREALVSDAAAWNAEFGTAKDVSGLVLERNVLRYLPIPVVVRITAQAQLRDALRVIAAGVAAESTPIVSSAQQLPPQLTTALANMGVEVAHENDRAWEQRLHAMTQPRGPEVGGRIRLVAGADAAAEYARILDKTDGMPDISVYNDPVVRAGRVEMLPFLREQAVSITAHRFGTLDRFSEGLI